MDVTIAFLYGNLRKVIYIEQPSWFIQHGREHKVCHLFKSLYGLKQAPQNWYDYFTHYLITLGYTKGKMPTPISTSNMEIIPFFSSLLFMSMIYF
jgi:hypothetical protein